MHRSVNRVWAACLQCVYPDVHHNMCTQHNAACVRYNGLPLMTRRMNLYALQRALGSDHGRSNVDLVGGAFVGQSCKSRVVS
jgi:hypothetical protein